jgi:hypothetical protein
MKNYSEATLDDAIRTWEQLIGVRSLEQAIQIQSDYAKRVYENHLAELSKLGELTVGMMRDASKPVDEALEGPDSGVRFVETTQNPDRRRGSRSD